MSIPTAVFFDTSIYAGQQYNFDSAAFKTFIPVAKAHEIKVLLPDPTRREITRQIKSRSDEALAALEMARKKAPFLEKWEHFPKNNSSFITSWQVDRIASTQWQRFLSNFDVVSLGYEQVDLRQIMDWYDRSQAPFREGKKRKEFPDALAIQIVERYSELNGLQIAVVSSDVDMREACDRYPNLLHFKTLPRLTEVILGSDSDVEVYREVLEKESEYLDQSVQEAAEGALTFSPPSDGYEVVEDQVISAIVYEHSIVALGDGECTITFESEIETHHLLEWEEEVWDDRTELESDWSLMTSYFAGVAKVSMDLKEKKITAVTSLAFESPWVDIDAP